MNKRSVNFQFRLLALCLTVNLTLPSPVFALKPTEAKEGAGLEELDKTIRSFVSGNPDDLKTAGARLAQAAELTPGVNPLSPTAGLEEFKMVMQLDSASTEEYSHHSLIAYNPTDHVLLLGNSEEPYEGDEYSSPSDTYRIHTWTYRVPTKEEGAIKGELKKAFSDGKLGIRQITFGSDGKSVYLHKAGRRSKSGTENILAYNWKTGAAMGSEIAFNGDDLDVQDVAGSPDGKTVFVLARHPYSWSILPFSIRTGQPRTKEAIYLNAPLSSQGKDFDSDLIQAMLGGIPPTFATPNELLIDPYRDRLYVHYVHGRILAEFQGIEVHTYDLATRQQIGPIFRVQTKEWLDSENYSGKTLALSPDGKTLYVGVAENDDPFRDLVVAFDAETGQQQSVAKIPGRISSLAVSPDGVVTAISFFHGGKTEKQLVEFLTVLQAVPPGEQTTRLPLNAQPPGPPASGLEETLSEHIARVNGILDTQGWQELQDAARSLRNLIDRVIWEEGIETNRQALHQLDALVQRVQGLSAVQHPQDLQADRLLRRWEANAAALLSAASFGPERFLSERAASGFLQNEQSLEGHLLYRIGTLWEQSVDRVGRPESVGLMGLRNRYPDLSLDFVEEPRIWINAIEVMLWTTPFDRFEQSTEELSAMYRQGPALLLVPLITQFTNRVSHPDRVLEAFIQTLEQMGRVPLHVRRAFLLQQDAAILNLLGVYYQAIGAVADRVGQRGAAEALNQRAVSIYNGISRFVDANFEVWRPPFAVPAAIQPAVQPPAARPAGQPSRPQAVQYSPDELMAKLRQAGIDLQLSKTRQRKLPQLLSEPTLNKEAIFRVLGRDLFPGKKGGARATKIAEVFEALRTQPQRTSLGNHIAQINRMIEERRWADLPQMSRQLVELMMQILPREIARNSGALHQLDQTVQRVQGLTSEQRPQDTETDRVVRRWEANAIILLSAASFQSELYLSEATARNFLTNQASLEGHLWFGLDRVWGDFVREGRASQVGLGGIPWIAVPPQQQGQEWTLWLDALQVLMWTTPREQYDPTQVYIGPLLEDLPAQTLPSLIAQWDPQGSIPSSSKVRSVFPVLVERMGRVPLDVRLGFLLRRDAPLANLSGAFLHFVSALADRVGSPHAGEFMSQRAVERYDSINRVIDPNYQVWRPTFTAGLEEGEGRPVTRREFLRTVTGAAVGAAVPSLIPGRSEARSVANPPIARQFRGEIVIEDLVVGQTTSPQPLYLEIAAHETLLEPVRNNFRGIPIRSVAIKPEQAAKDLEDFTVEDQVYRMVVLDRMLLDEPAQVAKILPNEHAPTFLIYGAEANLLTPAVAAAILKLQLSADGLFLLKLRQDDLGQTHLTIYA